MISIDDHPPPDPSSSDPHNHQLQVSHELKIDSGEKAPTFVSEIDLLNPTDDNLDDTNNRLPTFSIRDYVFGSRCKDITRNWPFSPKSLQLCLDSGVKNFLPPFQSLDSLRCNSSTRNEETIMIFNDKSTVDRLVVEELNYMKPKKSLPASSQPVVKKSKSIMKTNSGIEPIEDITPNNFIISETMASKVCPVCKTFSSSSNTTLNAHIDRCLSEESTMKWTANPKVMVKHRIKPRKTRLMVDIYKTAPRCTVEELDRRNGTNWATNSNFPDQELDAEEEKEEPHEQAFIPEVADHKGAVYIDTNGTKVRILSMPDDREAETLQKVGKASKIVMEKEKKKKKKAHVQKRCVKFLKLDPTSKKLSSQKRQHGASEARSGKEENVGVERSCKKEDGGEKDKPMKAKIHEQMEDFDITRPPWACSKRTVLVKKFNGKNGKLHLGLDATNESLLESDKSSDTVSSSQHSKKARTSLQLSNGSNLSSLKTNLLLSASRQHDLESKINLKRKFSAVKKSHENDDPSHDSMKHKSRMEEDISIKKPSFDKVNVMEVIKKKKSISSKSSDGDSLESERTEIPSYSNHIQGSFMSLRNSTLDDQFSNPESQLDNKFDLQESMEKNIMIGEHNIEDHMNDTEKHGNYFHQVDPIPIPGPPGSFLPPSPGGDMVSDEHQGNSSLTTTSRVDQSSEDRHHHHNDTMNRDFMSESPISTVSSPSFARSGKSRHDGKLFIRSFTSQQDKKPAPMVSSVITEKGSTPSAFQNDQPCCCSRKEGVFSKNATSYPRESFVSREQAHESYRRPSSMNISPELFSSLPTPSETVKSHPDASMKFPVHRDCESAVSPSTPVLRLMGKNLTVFKTDDHEQFRPPMSNQQQFHEIQNDQNSFFYGYPSQHPINFNHNQNGSKPQHFNVHPPNNPRSITNLRHIHAFDTIFPSTRNGFMAPAEYHRIDDKIACDRNIDNITLKAKEIITIDDSSENEADDGVSPAFFNGTLQTSSTIHGNFGSWGCTPTGSSSILHKTSLQSPLAFIPNIRSSTAYYPHNFS